VRYGDRCDASAGKRESGVRPIDAWNPATLRNGEHDPHLLLSPVAASLAAGVVTPISRRGFGTAVAGCVIAGIAAPHRAVAGASGSPDRPVVGFHNDAPWIDTTGRDTPYRPPHAAGRFAADATSLALMGHFL
jgi:hypothetical protein